MAPDTQIDHPEPPVQLTRKLVAAYLLRGRAQAAHRIRAAGGMKAFLAQARAIQNLPSFGRRMRE